MKTNKKLLTNVAMILIAGFAAVTLTSCPAEHGNKLEMTCIKPNTQNVSNRPKVVITLENSMSMKGYVPEKNKIEFPNMTFESHVGDLVSKLNNCDFSTQWQCGNKKGKTTLDLYNNGIKDGAIFSEGDTPLEKYIKQVGEQANDTTVSIFVSDMIFSISRMQGNPNAIKNSLPKLQTLVKDALRPLAKNQIHLLLIQYTSDFNGKYYYNCTNNLTPCAFKQIVLHKRPYYFLVVGTQDNLNSLLETNVFPKYEKIWATFTLNDGDFTAQDVVTESNNYWYVDPEGDPSLTFNYIAMADFEGQQTNVDLSFSALNERAFLSAWQPTSHSHAIANMQKLSDSEIKVNFIAYNQLADYEEVTISLVSERADWKNCSTDNDIISADESAQLEGKTWSFDKLMEAFSDVYPNIIKPETVGSFSFTLLKE